MCQQTYTQVLGTFPVQMTSLSTLPKQSTKICYGLKGAWGRACFRLWFVSPLSMFSCPVAPVPISLKISNVEDPCRHSFRRISRFSKVFLWETEEPSSFKPSEEQFLLIFPKWNAKCPRISCCVHGPCVSIKSGWKFILWSILFYLW